MRAPFVGILIALLTLLTLAGCSERLKEGAEREEKTSPKMINVNGKMQPAAPDWITEPYCLVDGKQVPARLVRTKCDGGKCVLYVIKDKRDPARKD